MSKYEQLWKYLQTNGSHTVKLTFEEIKAIIGFDMDHSFLTYKKEVCQFGYQVGKISMKEKHIIFNKLDYLNMGIELRLEEEKDYVIVEELTREAFWNVHFPGCDEHLLIHNVRKATEFIPELDFVAMYNTEIIGNIVYVKSKIIDLDKEYIVVTFGPISVLPKYQSKGIGRALIEHTKLLAKEMGYKAIIIYGDPEYYKRFGFKASKEYNITNNDGKYPAALLVLELYPNSLNGIQGKFDEGKIYEINEKELEEYERGFIKKEKGITKTQERFNELVKKYI